MLSETLAMHPNHHSIGIFTTSTTAASYHQMYFHFNLNYANVNYTTGLLLSLSDVHVQCVWIASSQVKIQEIQTVLHEIQCQAKYSFLILDTGVFKSYADCPYLT